MDKNKFHFKFSLEVLNHLGRGLYRSFATVVAEAISNAWDAEAKVVNILIEKDKLTVSDNGKGMSEEDFQNRFLEVGYSRREDSENVSKRNVIGRKGIGKLAMLSISESITIISKKNGYAVTGGKINNNNLDKGIKENKEYFLEKLSKDDIQNNLNIRAHGTKIIFERFKTQMNSEDIIRKYLATHFNFIFSLNENDSFQIKVNGKKVTHDDLRELNGNTQFLWLFGGYDEDIKNSFNNLAPTGEKVISGKKILATHFNFNGEQIDIMGYIASVKTSSDLVLRGSGGDFRAGLNLFTNGRLRQKDLLEDITTKGLAEEYLYGEIHVDGFEDGKIDRFTSSREGIIKDDPLYREFLLKLKEIIKIVINDWSPWRREIKEDWDLNNENMPKYKSRMEQGHNYREKDFKRKIDENIADKDVKKSLKERLKKLSYKNTLVYQDLFILENIFREYIKLNKIEESNFDNTDSDEKEIIDFIKSTRGRRIEGEAKHALKGKIVKEENYLNYADLWYLASIVDLFTKKDEKKPVLKKHRKELCPDVKEINPIRNPIMHTNEITDDVMNWDKIKNVIDYMDRLKNKNCLHKTDKKSGEARKEKSAPPKAEKKGEV